MIRIFSGPEKISPLSGAPKAGWQIFIFDWILLLKMLVFISAICRPLLSVIESMLLRDFIPELLDNHRENIFFLCLRPAHRDI